MAEETRGALTFVGAKGAICPNCQRLLSDEGCDITVPETGIWHHAYELVAKLDGVDVGKGLARPICGYWRELTLSHFEMAELRTLVKASQGEA